MATKVKGKGIVERQAASGELVNLETLQRITGTSYGAKPLAGWMPSLQVEESIAR